jgi:hypothetical protein
MQTAMEAILRRILMNPGSTLEFAVAAFLAALTFVLVLNKVGGAFNLALAQTSRAAIVLVVSLAVELGALAYLGTLKLPGWSLPVAAVVLVLVVAVPLACLVLKGRYAAALVPMLLSIAAAAVVILFVHTIFNAIGGGGKSVGSGLRHNRDVENVMQQK